MTLGVCQGHSSIASLFYSDKHVARAYCFYYTGNKIYRNPCADNRKIEERISMFS